MPRAGALPVDYRGHVSELDEAAEWLEKITRDPMIDARPGSVTVLSVTDPVGRSRYQECTVELRTAGDGIPDAQVTTAIVLPRKVWPRVGDILPARISASDPSHLEVDWEALTRR